MLVFRPSVHLGESKFDTDRPMCKPKLMIKSTRRGLSAFLTIPLWLSPWSGKTLAAINAGQNAGTITINPREIWLREIVYSWLRNAHYYEQQNGKQWSDEFFSRDDIAYLTEILQLDSDGLRTFLRKPWSQMIGGSTSHIGWIAQSLKIHEDDGRLQLHLNSDNPDYFTTSVPDVHRAYATVSPVVNDLLAVT